MIRQKVKKHQLGDQDEAGDQIVLAALHHCQGFQPPCNGSYYGPTAGSYTCVTPFSVIIPALDVDFRICDNGSEMAVELNG